MKTIIAIALAAGIAVALTACGVDIQTPEPQKPIVEMVKLPDGTKVPCILLPDETETSYEEMDCDYPEDPPAK